MRFLLWIRGLFRSLLLLLHRCPPPKDQIITVKASLGDVPTWQQHECPVCHEVTHYRRDRGGEPFTQWTTALNGAPIKGHIS